jgi:translocation and assembly module TamA
MPFSACILAAAGAYFSAAGPAHAFNAKWKTAAPDELVETLKSASAIWTAKVEEQTDPAEIIAAVQTDYRTLLAAFYREGYYAPLIHIDVDGTEGKDVSLVDLPSKITSITLTVDAGPRFTFGTAQVSPLPSKTDLPESFASGQTARAGAVGDAKDAAIDAWRARSHAMAQLSGQSIVADHNTKTLDVALDIAPGPQVTFGTLHFEGQTTVPPARLLEITGAIEGNRYDPEAFNTLSKRLRNTDAFSTVSISQAEDLNPDNSINVIAIVNDSPPRRFGFGAQVSSLEGGSLEAYWLHRNITNDADRLRFDGEISGIASSTGVDYTLSASYRRPATTRPVLTFFTKAELARLDEPDYLSSTASLVVGAEVDISDKSYFSGGIGYRYSDVSDDLGDRTFSHIILPVEASRDTRDNKLTPTSGTYFGADVTPFIGLGSSETGARLFGDIRAYKGFGKDDRFVLAARITAGSILGSGITETPPDFLFFSGGSGTVRGQPYQSLSIDLGGDVETGGLSYLALSTELRTDITDTISVVGFYDVGSISSSSTPGSAGQSHAGAGLGLRYNTGFGPIRFDIAAPVSGETGDGLQFYVGIGQAF